MTIYVTMKFTFTKTYVVNAKDWEYAEDYAEDELYGEVFSRPRWCRY